MIPDFGAATLLGEIGATKPAQPAAVQYEF